MMTVVPIAEEVLKGDLSSLKDKDVNNLLNKFGYEEEINNEDKYIPQVKQEEVNVLQDSYNTTLMENQTLREANKKQKSQIQELSEKVEFLTNQLSGLSNLVNLLKITDKKEKLKQVSDEDIDRLYVENLTSGKKQLNNAFVIKIDDKKIIPKSYYEI